MYLFKPIPFILNTYTIINSNGIYTFDKYGNQVEYKNPKTGYWNKQILNYNTNELHYLDSCGQKYKRNIVTKFTLFFDD